VHVPGALLDVRDRLDASLIAVSDLSLSLSLSLLILLFFFLLFLAFHVFVRLTSAPNVRAACSECPQHRRRSFPSPSSCRLTARSPYGKRSPRSDTVDDSAGNEFVKEEGKKRGGSRRREEDTREYRSGKRGGGGQFSRARSRNVLLSARADFPRGFPPGFYLSLAPSPRGDILPK